MDIFDRNPQRVKAIQTAILEAEFALQESAEYKKLQLLKEQRAALPNNQAYSMGKYNVVGERPRWTPEQLAESKRRTDFENEMDWETNELAYAKFCELHSLETF